MSYAATILATTTLRISMRRHKLFLTRSPQQSKARWLSQLSLHEKNNCQSGYATVQKTKLLKDTSEDKPGSIHLDAGKLEVGSAKGTLKHPKCKASLQSPSQRSHAPCCNLIMHFS